MHERGLCVGLARVLGRHVFVRRTYQFDGYGVATQATAFVGQGFIGLRLRGDQTCRQEQGEVK